MSAWAELPFLRDLVPEAFRLTADLEISACRVPVPLDGVNLALDQFRQACLNVVRQPAEDEA